MTHLIFGIFLEICSCVSNNIEQRVKTSCVLLIDELRTNLQTYGPPNILMCRLVEFSDLSSYPTDIC